MFDKLRDFIGYLEKEKDLIKIEEELSPQYEISAVLREIGVEEGPAILFQKVKGYSIAVMGNLLGTRRRMAHLFQTGEKELEIEYLKRKEKFIPPEVVKEGPVKDVIIKDGIDLLKTIPVLTHHEKDIGPYITAGVAIAKDPETGTRSMGLHRIPILDKAKMGIALATPPLSDYLARAEQKGQPLEIAVAIGVDPITLFSSVIWVPSTFNKFAIAGGLRTTPVPLIKCETIDVEVPAKAEIIIEGKIPPGVREKDGPFGESTGYYTTHPSPIIEVTAITHRKDPVYQAIEPWIIEDDILMGLSFGPEIYRRIKELIPTVQGVYLVPGTCGTHAVVSIKKRDKGEAREALLQTLLLSAIIKKAVIVDDDVDITNPREVEWAIATRFQADEDLIMLPAMRAFGIDPSIKETKEGYVSAKIGMDATKPLWETEKFEKIKVPMESKEKAKTLLKKYR